jgi:hypothetical protein
MKYEGTPAYRYILPVLTAFCARIAGRLLMFSKELK